jgi:DMSO/TMAO reductase YedYZ heme-binding membrane subunit
LNAAQVLGWLASLALVGSLLASRFPRVTAHARRRARRRLGIAAAAGALLHALASLVGPLNGAWLAIADVPALRWGALALSILVTLWATSYPRLNARLGLRSWGAIHRLVYPAAALTVLHVLEAPDVDVRWAVMLALSLSLTLLLRLVPRRRKDRSDLTGIVASRGASPSLADTPPR